MKVAVICTVKNEAETIADLIDSLMAQSKKPDEIILVDGGSKDKTVEIIMSYIRKGFPIKLLRAPGANIAKGRNLAIKEAMGEVIASTDAGCILDSRWLENIVMPIEQGYADVVGGWYEPDSRNWIEECIALFSYPLLESVLKKPEEFLPSGRSIAFKKEVWRKVGGYPEELDVAEDTLFDLRIKKAGFRYRFEPKALVYWRPRPNVLSFFKQHFKYAKGNAQAALYIPRYILLISIYSLGAFLLIHGLLKERYLYFFAPTILFLVYTATLGFRRILKACMRNKKCILLFPIFRAGFDLSRVLGFIYGTILRIRRRQ